MPVTCYALVARWIRLGDWNAGTSGRAIAKMGHDAVATVLEPLRHGR